MCAARSARRIRLATLAACLRTPPSDSKHFLHKPPPPPRSGRVPINPTGQADGKGVQSPPKPSASPSSGRAVGAGCRQPRSSLSADALGGAQGYGVLSSVGCGGTLRKATGVPTLNRPAASAVGAPSVSLRVAPRPTRKARWRPLRPAPAPSGYRQQCSG